MRILPRPLSGMAVAFGLALLLNPIGLPDKALAGNGMVLAQQDPDQQDDPSSAAALLVRVDRLENRIRTMTGQIEQLQYQNKRLDDALRKMQQDVDFRFQDLNRGATPPGGKPPLQKRGDLGDAPGDAVADGGAAPSATSPDGSVAGPAAGVAAKPQRRGDAFDPASDPNAVGAPKPLGTTLPSAPLRSSMPASGTASTRADPHAPLDLMHVPQSTPAPPDGTVAALDPAQRTATAPAVTLVNPNAPPGTPLPGAAPPSGAPAAGGGVASLTPGSTRSEYDADYALYKNGQYDAAATGLQDFIQKYPRDRLLPDATYFLGESYARLGRHREAAEQFLKLSTDYTKSPKAPDALLRLGVALNALGAKDQACATYQEVDRKFPTASPDVRAGVDRELKRARC